MERDHRASGCASRSPLTSPYSTARIVEFLSAEPYMHRIIALFRRPERVEPHESAIAKTYSFVGMYSGFFLYLAGW